MRLVFEKPAGAMATLLYGDWDANKVWSRVKVRITGLDGGGQLVTCNLYRVTDHGDANFEVEHKVSAVKKGPYRAAAQPGESPCHPRSAVSGLGEEQGCIKLAGKMGLSRRVPCR